jgi:hypothetical protein
MLLVFNARRGFSFLNSAFAIEIAFGFYLEE